MRRALILATVASTLLFCSLWTWAQGHSTPAQKNARPWWYNAVIYEVYPRSFQDTNGDGIGDLNGVIERLGYLQKLGVNAIWLTPIYPSPQVDFGYDISDYRAINPVYGNMADFHHLIADAKAHHIGVIMDMVFNHTSTESPWFIEASSSRENPRHDWYIWRDAKMVDGKREPPSDMINGFVGGPAWQWVPNVQQYYYHTYAIRQADLNWRNPQVRKMMFNIVRFWIKQGVAGFRLDSIQTIFKNPAFPNEPYLRNAKGQIKINAFGDKEVSHAGVFEMPPLHAMLRQLRQVTDTTPDPIWGHRVVLIGETYLHSTAELRSFYGANNDELNLPMDMQVGMINKLDVAAFRKNINAAETEINGNMPLFVFDNHDNPRMDRYTGGVPNVGVERVLATILFASRDTALMYYGDAIGMRTTPPTRKSEVRDIAGIRGWPKIKGRDGERTPMQWTPGPNAGFSKAGITTWLPIPPTYKTVNVQTEESNPDSLLNWYKNLIALRHTNPAFIYGHEVMLDTTNDSVLSWLRETPGKPAVVVACNFTAQPQTISFDLNGEGVHSKAVKTLIESPGAVSPSSLAKMTIPGYGVYIGQIE